MFYPVVVFIEIGSPDILRFTHQSFLEYPVRPIYYFYPPIYPSIIFREPGSSDILCFTHQSFLENPGRLIYYVLPISRL